MPVQKLLMHSVSCQKVKATMSTIKRFTILMYDRSITERFTILMYDRSTIKRFTILLYNWTNCHMNVNETRRQLFTKKEDKSTTFHHCTALAHQACSLSGHILFLTRAVFNNGRYECWGRSKVIYLKLMPQKPIF